MACVAPRSRRWFSLVALALGLWLGSSALAALAQSTTAVPASPTTASAPSASGGLSPAGATTPVEPQLPTHGDKIPTRNMLTMIRDGGPVMIPIIGCSFLLLVYVFERAMALRTGRVIPRPFVTRFLEQLDEQLLDREKALELCEENQSAVASVFAAAVKKWGRPSVEVEQAVLDAGERATNSLRKNVRLFNAISTVTPLLGLLGTVFGMITSFNTIASADAMGKPNLLADGIGEALLTTAAGLSVAIPALCAYWFFVGRVDKLIVEIDALGQEVVELISSDGARAVSVRSRPAKKEKAA